MYYVSTARFQKLRTCPSAEVLIEYKDAGLPRARKARVARHLAVCEFCSAELQLLSKHRADYCPISRFADEIPTHLRRLAEELLAQPSLNRASFLETLFEPERLTLTDVA